MKLINSVSWGFWFLSWYLIKLFPMIQSIFRFLTLNYEQLQGLPTNIRTISFYFVKISIVLYRLQSILVFYIGYRALNSIETESSSTGPGCSESHSAWPWTHPGTGHPQLCTTCATASAPSPYFFCSFCFILIYALSV